LVGPDWMDKGRAAIADYKAHNKPSGTLRNLQGNYVCTHDDAEHIVRWSPPEVLHLPWGRPRNS